MIPIATSSSLARFASRNFFHLQVPPVIYKPSWSRELCPHGSEQAIEANWTEMIHAHLIKLHKAPTTAHYPNLNRSAQSNFLVTSYINNGHPDSAVKIYVSMRKNGIRLDNLTMPSVIKACAQVGCVRLGEEIHGFVMKTGLDDDVFLLNALISMYGECGKVSSAGFLFDEMPERDSVSWSTIIGSHFRNGLFYEAVELVRDMLLSGSRPTDALMMIMGSLFAHLGNSVWAKAVHAWVIRNNSHEKMVKIPLATALINMHTKCRNLLLARRLFNGLTERSIVSWTSMISGCIRCQQLQEAAELFSNMLGEGIAPNEVTLLSLVTECGSLGALQVGKQIHGYVLRGSRISSALVSALTDMYGKSGGIKYADELFNRSANRDISMWNVMISAYSRIRCIDEATDCFVQMKASGLRPTKVSLLAVMPLYAESGDLILGRWIHSGLMKLGMAEDLMLKAAVLDMYTKCGMLNDASRLFNEANFRDICMWNTMISGYGKHGRGNKALQLFRKMEEEGTKPNDTTFIAILNACSHCGLIEEGKRMFWKMIHDIGLVPKVEHYGCMVDLFGRAGLLEEALQLIESMPLRPNVIVWGALLSASRLHRNSKLEQLASKRVLEMEPQSSGYHVLMSNFHAAADRWDNVEEVRQRMVNLGIKKEAGLSAIEVDGWTHEFRINSTYTEICPK